MRVAYIVYYGLSATSADGYLVVRTMNERSLLEGEEILWDLPVEFNMVGRGGYFTNLHDYLMITESMRR